MKRSEFNKIKKEVIYYLDRGFTVNEFFDDLWRAIDDEQMRNKELWKEVKKLRKKLVYSL